MFNTYYSGVWVQLSKKTHYFAYLALIHRRRIELEDKAKVIALDWGTESSVFLKQRVELNRLCQKD